MPRIGMNPNRGKKSNYQPARTTIAVLTYTPNEVGYFEKRFAVTRMCLESILKNTREPYDLMVFDNGSRIEAVNYLKSMRDRGEIDFLILSKQNIGKIGALQIITKAAPGEVLAYCDDDIFFLPAWLKEHLKVLDTYPDVGFVTGFYIKSHMKHSIQSTLKFAKSPDVKSEWGNLIEPERESHYIRQMGRTQERYLSEIAGIEDLRMTYKGVTVFASAGHHQLVARKKIMLEALPKEWTGNLMGQMRELDESIDKLGKLRLCTFPDTTRLLGNLIDQKMAEEIKSYDIEIEASGDRQEMKKWKKRFLRTPLIQKIAYFFYERFFKIINA